MSEPHGGNVMKFPKCLDFSANLNPLGMPQSVRQAILESVDLWEYYPDPECLSLRKAIARHTDVPYGGIVCGNGADDLIWRIVQALRPKQTLIAVPTFSEYRRALESVGCAVESFSLLPENGFILPETFLSALHPGVDLVILCHPNNPTGQLIPQKLLHEIARICEQNGIYLLIDACFLDLTVHPGALPHSPHTIVLNAFTKTYVMPGLRLGYAIFGENELAESVSQTGQYWSVSTPAQIAGCAALRETAYLEQSRAVIAEERHFLMEALQKLSPCVIPSQANFILFQARTGLFHSMLEEHIHIRSCENFEGLDGTWYRIAVRPHDENERLIDAFRRCL